jgi:hypothetical protein
MSRPSRSVLPLVRRVVLASAGFLVVAVGISGCSGHVSDLEACGVTTEEVSAIMGTPVEDVDVTRNPNEGDVWGGALPTQCNFNLDLGDYNWDTKKFTNWDGAGDTGIRPGPTIRSLDVDQASPEGRDLWLGESEGTFESRPDWGVDGLFLETRFDYRAVFEFDGRLWEIIVPHPNDWDGSLADEMALRRANLGSLVALVLGGSG